MSDKKMTMEGIAAMAIGILTLIVIYGVVPLVGSSLDTAITIPAGSDWNATENTDIPTGASTWTTLAPFLTLSAILIMVFGFLRVLKGARSD